MSKIHFASPLGIYRWEKMSPKKNTFWPSGGTRGRFSLSEWVGFNLLALNRNPASRCRESEPNQQTKSDIAGCLARMKKSKNRNLEMHFFPRKSKIANEHANNAFSKHLNLNVWDRLCCRTVPLVLAAQPAGRRTAEMEKHLASCLPLVLACLFSHNQFTT